MEYIAKCESIGRSESTRDGKHEVYQNANLVCGERAESVDSFTPSSGVGLVFAENIPFPLLAVGKTYRVTFEEVPDGTTIGPKD